jgi:general secretion pathway protein A
MYEAYYGLRERPFDLTPDPRFLFLTPKHQEALTTLEYGISRRRGVTVVLGPAGTGKTTLIRAALATLKAGSAQCVYINNPALRRDEFVQTIAHAFQLNPEASRSKATMLLELEQKLTERLAAGATTALIVDEAQALSEELLEEIRLLVNLETETDKLLPVVLVGQIEFAERLAQPSCAALKQRIALRCQLLPLSAQETAHYVATRLRTAGGNPAQSFTREAIHLIHQCSHGIPRTVNVICDNALLSGFAAGQRPVSQQLIREVCRDYDFDTAGDPVEVAVGAGPERSVKPEPVRQMKEEPASQDERKLFGTFGRPTRSWFSR